MAQASMALVTPPSGGAFSHRTVLLEEAVNALVTKPTGVYVDATFGRGGHARRVLSCLAPTGRLIAVDRDPQAVAHACQGDEPIRDARFSIVQLPFSEWPQALLQAGHVQADGLLLDVGVSSPQIDDPTRGFSFRHDGPLDMRMDPSQGQSAAQFIEQATLEGLVQVIRDYGEERFAGPIARALIARRDSGHSVQTTLELAALVARVVKTREPGQDPATRTFQALRIAVNRELDELHQALQHALTCLRPGGRLVVISFHSLEDRMVKQFIARESRSEVDRRAPFAPPQPTRLKAVARVRPTAVEVARNGRARSALMRVAERTEVTS